MRNIFLSSPLLLLLSSSVLLLLLLLSSSSSSKLVLVEAMTFSLQPGNTKCFTEELSTSHRVHLEYAMPKSRSLFTSVYLTSPDGRHIYDEKRNTHKNTHVFHPQTQGEYAVCFVSIEKRSSIPSFDITVTMLAEFEVATQKSLNYESTKTTDNQKNKALMVQAKYAADNLFSIHEDFKNHLEREQRLRITTETAFTRSNVMSVITLLIIGGVTYFGYLTLKRHLVSKRILD